MENTRYTYSPIIKRKPFKLPGQARVALWFGVNIEYFDIGGSDYGGAGSFNVPPPNVFDYAARDYGNRVGLWRLMELLDKHGIKASVLLNSDLCEQYPMIIEEGKKRGWEFLGHGTSNSILLGGKTEDEERQIITTAMEVVKKAVGEPPLGWLSPALQETFKTPDILAGAGIRYLCDWCCDDQPFPMKVKSGHLISLPYTVDLNDIPAFLYHHMAPEQFSRMIIDQFDTLYREGAQQARVMCIALHPFLIGQAYRIGWLDKALSYIKGHEDVWIATAGEIAGWYYEKYLGMKMGQN
ncbi:MAG: polysaccharide deacetylase family protein [Pseudomonadota bacterium]